MAEVTVVRAWSRRFKLIVGGAAALTAVVGVFTSIFSSYQSLQEAKQSRLDTKTSYELLVSKVNSMAERLAYVEGACSARAATLTEPARAATPAPTVSAPLPAPIAVAVSTDGDGIPSKPKPAKPAKPAKFKVEAYQQLPASLDSLLKSKDAYAE
jgi:hypothetical protein